MYSNFRSRIRKGDLLLGPTLTLNSPEIAEMMAEIGYDWLFVDTEHSPYNAQEARAMLQAVGDRCPCIVRVPSNDDFWIKKALDIGPDGIIVPMVNSAEEAARAVRSCKYPPEGTRGVGAGRAARYGIRFQEYLKNANQQLAVILQAETKTAAENMESIVKTPGVDAIFIGPYDLSANLGKIGQVTDPEVLGVMEQVSKTCFSAGIRMGIYAANPEAAKPFIQQGYTLISVSTDSAFLIKAATETLAELKS